MASILCSGPSQWYVAQGGGDYQYLGMCESDTMLDLAPTYEGIGIDGSGRGDFDRQFMDAKATVSGDLARWNEPVLDSIKNFVGVQGGGTPGQWTADSGLGTLLRTEEKAFALCIVAMFGQKEAFQAVGMHPAWLFKFVFPLPLRRNLSMRATRERIAFECLTVWNGDGSGTLYTNEAPEGLPDPD